MKEKILVSACLLGAPCRYDGASKPNQSIIDLKKKYIIIPVCPEEFGGLPTPRKPCEIFGESVICIDGRDLTCAYRSGAEIVLRLANTHMIKFAVLKEKSPSCGKTLRYDGTFTRTLTEGSGVTASLLMQNGFLVYSEEEIENAL